MDKEEYFMTGKEKCNLLKQIRQEIAESNGIVYLTSDCTFEGPCTGTCPKCDAEIRYLEGEINRLASEGTSITLSALSASVIDNYQSTEMTVSNDMYSENQVEEDEDFPCVEGMLVCVDDKKEGLLEILIEELDLSVRSYNCLKRAGINTVEELIINSEEDLMVKVKNLGRKSLEEIIQKLSTLGLELRQDD